MGIEAKPLEASRLIPNCGKRIYRDVKFIPAKNGGYVAEQPNDKFFCYENGEREITFHPRPSQKETTAEGCRGCAFFTEE